MIIIRYSSPKGCDFQADLSQLWNFKGYLNVGIIEEIRGGSRREKTRPYRRVEWQRPIFPGGCPPSIVGAEGLNDRVRDGNECFLFAIVTTPPACTCGWVSSFLIGGDEGIRTPDLCRAKAALFQLSYIPSVRVGFPGLEPGTSVLSGLRSNHLS